MANDVDKMRDYDKIDSYFENATFWKQPSSISLDAGKGRVHVKMSTGDDVFFKVASEQCGIDVKDDFDLLKELKILCKDREKSAKFNPLWSRSKLSVTESLRRLWTKSNSISPKSCVKVNSTA